MCVKYIFVFVGFKCTECVLLKLIVDVKKFDDLEQDEYP